MCDIKIRFVLILVLISIRTVKIYVKMKDHLNVQKFGLPEQTLSAEILANIETLQI